MIEKSSLVEAVGVASVVAVIVVAPVTTAMLLLELVRTMTPAVQEILTISLNEISEHILAINHHWRWCCALD
jgi:hypothetical protein